jgi:NADH:ubiquinone oxidoreductase subunit F (NADH-binding)
MTAPTHAIDCHRRILSGAGDDLARHRAVYGTLPPTGHELIADVTASGLLGRGGAGFPAGTKLAAAADRRPVVVANGSEGEPLSSKDAELLRDSPHLILDGLASAARAIGSNDAYLVVPASVAERMRRLVGSRRSAGWDSTDVTVIESRGGFVSGEKTAVVSAIEGKPARPRDRIVSLSVSGVRGRPTVVHNVETLAHVATIARYGPHWFRSVGTADEPGTMLVTLSGALPRPGVVEVPVGSPMGEVLITLGGVQPDRLRAVLVGGFHGTWIESADALRSTMSRRSLRALGATPGAGIVHALGTSECGLDVTARIVRFLADDSAGQCGPCINGLPRLADAFDEIASGRAGSYALARVRHYANAVDGRGACHHPDGTARLVRSALTTFDHDIRLHGAGYCERKHKS